jgi:hypothetical protein
MASNNSSIAVAKRNSRPRIIPMPDFKSRLDFKKVFSQAEYDKLSHGVVPRNMDQKWFIFMEDGCLNIHRDSSGVCIYQVKLNQDNDGYSVSEAYVNRDQSQYKSGSDEHDTNMLAWLIDRLLLGKKRPPPSRQEWNV